MEKSGAVLGLQAFVKLNRIIKWSDFDFVSNSVVYRRRMV